MEKCEQLQFIIKSHLEGSEEVPADLMEVVQENAQKDTQEAAKVQKDIQENVQEHASRAPSLRSWVISIQTCLSGKPCDMKSMIDVKNFGIYSTKQNVTGAPIGFKNPSTLLYRVSEDHYEEGKHELEFQSKPLYNCSDFYKLDPRLAEFVGHDILQKPTCCLTTIKGYAREKNLYHKHTIKCDSVLYNIFEKFSLDNTSYATLMKDVYRLLKRVEVNKPISFSHELPERPLSTSFNLDIKVHNGKVYPKDWKTQTEANRLSRTQSLHPNQRVVNKRKTLKRNQSINF